MATEAGNATGASRSTSLLSLVVQEYNMMHTAVKFQLSHFSIPNGTLTEIDSCAALIYFPFLPATL